ncbi:Hsp20/alpha crystallin family protein [Paenibacillus sp. GYB003]|uniref:Hsp20/alpha crystallin family protein n=1 Tax=Paenibacillus sp. GYB003 TaxID=2994392 RepID=UPI002F964E55
MNGEKRRRSPGDAEPGFDWRRFEQLFDDLFPNAIPGLKDGSFSKIGQFVRSVMDRAVPGESAAPVAGSAKKTGLFQAEMTETRRYVKVRIRIPDYVDPRKLQLFVNGAALKIEGPLGNRQTFPLPAPVVLKSMEADYRDRALYVRLTKKSGSGYKEIYVRYP